MCDAIDAERRSQLASLYWGNEFPMLFKVPTIGEVEQPAWGGANEVPDEEIWLGHRSADDTASFDHELFQLILDAVEAGEALGFAKANSNWRHRNTAEITKTQKQVDYLTDTDHKLSKHYANAVFTNAKAAFHHGKEINSLTKELVIAKKRITELENNQQLYADAYVAHLECVDSAPNVEALNATIEHLKQQNLTQARVIEQYKNKQ